MEKIMGMLRSNESNLITLGIICALEMGPSWCLQNLPPFGHTNRGGNYRLPMHVDVIKVPTDMERQCHIKSGVAIVLRTGYLQCRKEEHFRRASMKNYKITNYDKRDTTDEDSQGEQEVS